MEGLEIFSGEGRASIVFPAEITEQNGGHLVEEVRWRMHGSNVERVEYDLRRLTFINSCGLKHLREIEVILHDICGAVASSYRAPENPAAARIMAAVYRPVLPPLLPPHVLFG